MGISRQVVLRLPCTMRGCSWSWQMICSACLSESCHIVFRKSGVISSWHLVCAQFQRAAIPWLAEVSWQMHTNHSGICSMGQRFGIMSVARLLSPWAEEVLCCLPESSRGEHDLEGPVPQSLGFIAGAPAGVHNSCSQTNTSVILDKALCCTKEGELASRGNGMFDTWVCVGFIQNSEKKRKWIQQEVKQGYLQSTVQEMKMKLKGLHEYQYLKCLNEMYPGSTASLANHLKILVLLNFG